MKFAFHDKGRALQTCINLTRKMTHFNEGNMSQILRSGYVADNFDEAKNKDIANALCDPANFNIFLRSKSIEPECIETEEWYSTKHVIAPFSDQLLAKIKAPKCEIKSKKLDLPPANTLIPKNFDILPANEE